jgi:hypothetical protein
VFLYVVLDRQAANLGLLRQQMREIVAELGQ